MTLGNQSAQNLSMAELYEGSAKAGVRFSQPREVVFPSGDLPLLLLLSLSCVQ